MFDKIFKEVDWLFSRLLPLWGMYRGIKGQYEQGAYFITLGIYFAIKDLRK